MSVMRNRLVKFIANTIDVPVAKASPAETPQICAFSGAQITEGVSLTSVVKSATANLADTFRYPSDVVSADFAKCFKAQRELRGNLFIDANGITKPLISGKTAAKTSRPTWVEVFEDYLANPRPSIFILTDESKRRLWLDAVVTEGDPIRVFLNNAEMAGVLALRQAQFTKCMVLVQMCLEYGFSKRAIGTSLFLHREVMQTIGIEKTQDLEKQCDTYREHPEFQVSLFVGTLVD